MISIYPYSIEDLVNNQKNNDVRQTDNQVKSQTTPASYASENEDKCSEQQVMNDQFAGSAHSSCTSRETTAVLIWKKMLQRLSEVVKNINQKLNSIQQTSLRKTVKFDEALKSKILDSFIAGIHLDHAIGESDQLRADVNRCEHALGHKAPFLTRCDDDAKEQTKLKALQKFLSALPNPKQALIVEDLLTQGLLGSVMSHHLVLMGHHDTLKIRCRTDKEQNVLITVAIRFTELKALYSQSLGRQELISDQKSVRANYEIHLKIGHDVDWNEIDVIRHGEKVKQIANCTGVSMTQGKFWTD